MIKNEKNSNTFEKNKGYLKQFESLFNFNFNKNHEMCKKKLDYHDKL